MASWQMRGVLAKLPIEVWDRNVERKNWKLRDFWKKKFWIFTPIFLQYNSSLIPPKKWKGAYFADDQQSFPLLHATTRLKIWIKRHKSEELINVVGDGTTGMVFWVFVRWCITTTHSFDTDQTTLHILWFLNHLLWLKSLSGFSLSDNEPMFCLNQKQSVRFEPKRNRQIKYLTAFVQGGVW